MQIFSEIGKSATQNGNLITTGLEDVHQAVDALCDGQMFGNVLHNADVESLQQGNATGETLLEVYLATHGTLRDGTHLGSHTVALGQLVDTLRLDERRVHIETDQAAHATEHVVFLEREVNLHLLRQFHQFRLHLLAVDGFATQRELYAGPHMFCGIHNAFTTCQAKNGVDVQSLVCQDTCCRLNLTGFQLSAQHHENVAVLALVAHPVFVFLVADGRETDVDTQFRGLEQQFLHGQTRFHLIHTNQDAQG